MDSPEKVATPAALVVAVVVPPNVPPPVRIATVTTTPDCATGLLDASRSCTTGCTAKGTPFCAVGDGWVVRESRLPPPAPTVMAVLVAGVRAPLLNVSVELPAGPLRVAALNVAAPDADVVAVPPPNVTPALGVTAALTWMPDWGALFPEISRSWTTGAVLSTWPLVALAGGCVVITSCVAVPAWTFTVPDVAGVSAPEVNVSVRAPVRPVIFRFEKVAAPDPLVVAVVVPPNVPVPGAVIAAWMTTPAAATVFPDASRSCTTGWAGKAMSFSAVDDGCVVIASWVATGSAVTVTVAWPLVPPMVACTMADPGATPVTSPAVLTVATAVLRLGHVVTRPPNAGPTRPVPAESRGVAVSCVVCPGATEGAGGDSETLLTPTRSTVTVAVPWTPSAVARIWTVPSLTPTTSPDWSTVAMLWLLDVQMIVRPASVCPAVLRATALNRRE